LARNEADEEGRMQMHQTFAQAEPYGFEQKDLRRSAGFGASLVGSEKTVSISIL
jgi:hypothetical protein